MLKKAGIIVAASTAGILAFTPLAFAGSKDHDADEHHGKDDKSSSKCHDKDDNGVHHHKSDDGDHHDGDDDGDPKDNLSNDCQFGNQGGSPVAGAFGGSSLLGAVAPVTSAAADATSQLNTLNCNNVNVTDLVDSTRTTDTSPRTRPAIDDSFNGNRQLIFGVSPEGPGPHGPGPSCVLHPDIYSPHRLRNLGAEIDRSPDGGTGFDIRAAECATFPLSRRELPTIRRRPKIRLSGWSGHPTGDDRAEEGWNHRGRRRDGRARRFLGSRSPTRRPAT